MKKGLFFALVVLAVGILIASMVTGQSRAAEPYEVVPLTGAAEVPTTGDPDGTGTAGLTIDTATNEVCLTISELTNVATPLTGAHIHIGAVGISGSIVVDFGVDSEDVVPFSLCVTDDDAANVVADPAGYYVNLHNAEFPAGAVRGQLIAPAAGTETPTEETPVGTVTEETPVATVTEGTPVETVVATPTTSVPVAGDLVVNGGFEDSLTGWTLKNTTGGDKIKTNKTDKTFAYEGSSAFKFKGGPGEVTALQQVPDLTGLVFGVGDTLDISIAVNAKKASAAGKVKVVAKYVDGTGDKAKFNLASTGNVYTVMTDQVILTQSFVSKIKILVKNTSPDGKIFVDAVSVALVDVPDATATAEETVAATETVTVEATLGATETATVEGTAAATETATVESTVAATETATEEVPVDLVPLP